MPSLLHSVFQTGIERHESLLAYFQDRELLRSIVSALNDIEILTDLWLYPIEDEAGFESASTQGAKKIEGVRLDSITRLVKQRPPRNLDLQHSGMLGFRA